MSPEQIFEQAYKIAKAISAAEQDLTRALECAGLPKPAAEKLARGAAFDFIQEEGYVGRT